MKERLTDCTILFLICAWLLCIGGIVYVGIDIERQEKNEIKQIEEFKTVEDIKMFMINERKR